MNGKIRLAVFDLDGTLLDDDDTLRPETASALRDLSRAGTMVMICSGRVPSMAGAYLYEAGIDGIFACANGAYIAGKDGSVLFENTISADVLIPVTEALLRRGVHFSLMTEKDLYSNQDNRHLRNRFLKYQKLAQRYGLSFPDTIKVTDFTDILYMPVYKVAVIEPDAGKVEGHLRFLRGLGDRIEVTRSGRMVLDITARGISKGSAVRFAADHLKIKKEEICCVGDYDNDISMFWEAGLSIAMGNASDRVKTAADYVTGNHCAGGVQEAVRRYILPQNAKN